MDVCTRKVKQFATGVDCLILLPKGLALVYWVCLFGDPLANPIAQQALSPAGHKHVQAEETRVFCRLWPETPACTPTKCGASSSGLNARQ